ncbi:MAG TPA: hypothetical protein VHB79_10425 [Polyangiaceae bacterium]|nr:hypothetical protein [Polyangiaceae bacterium]
MNRADKLAKLQRDMAQLRSRLIRLQGESDMAVRDLRELQTEIEALIREERP